MHENTLYRLSATNLETTFYNFKVCVRIFQGYHVTLFAMHFSSGVKSTQA